MTSPRTPRQWNAGDAEPEDCPVLRDHAPGAGFIWETPIQREGIWGNDYGQWMPWAKVLERYGPLSEVLPETPEPPRLTHDEARVAAIGQMKAAEQRREDVAVVEAERGAERCYFEGCPEWITGSSDYCPTHAKLYAPVPASQSVPAVPVSSTGGKETGEGGKGVQATSEAWTLHTAIAAGIKHGLADFGAELTGCTAAALTGHVISQLREAGLHPRERQSEPSAETTTRVWRDPADPERIAVQYPTEAGFAYVPYIGVDGEFCYDVTDPDGKNRDEWVELQLPPSPLPDSETEWGIRPIGQDEVEETGAEEWARAVCARMPTLYVAVFRRPVGPWVEVTS